MSTDKLDFLKKTKPTQLILPIMLALSVLSIYAFSSFKPKLSESDVVANTRKSNIPLLLNSEILSDNSALNTENITLKTETTPEEVLKFYENVLSKDSWVLESEAQEEGFFTKRYKKDDDFMSISTTTQKNDLDENYTIVTVTFEDN